MNLPLPSLIADAPPSRVVIAMSGGVDSSVTAAMLVAAGHQCVGAFMRTGASLAPSKAHGADAKGSAAHGGATDGSGGDGEACSTKPVRAGKQGCCSLEDSLDARAVAGRLGIPFYSLNHEADFKTLIAHFVDEYRRARTPNPCVICNRDIKFGALLEFADNVFGPSPDGDENAPPPRIATGHYASIRFNADAQRYEIWRGRDTTKDQSYVLWPLSQAQLARTWLPLGDMEKAEVRARAADTGLRTADKPDSYEICFVPNNDYRALIERDAPDALVPGQMLDMQGRVVGQHHGYAAYTIGQRRGLGVALGRPAYVVAIDAARNVVVVGDESATLATGCTVDDVNWVSLAPQATGDEFRCLVQIRYRHVPAPATARVTADGLDIRFDAPIAAVTPGQCAVLYGHQDDGADEPRRLLVGGWINQAATLGTAVLSTVHAAR